MFKGIPEANVYGVTVPNCDGRAGMAAITGADLKSLDWNGLVAHLTKNLPRYAIPVFLRFMPQMDVTSTFKHLKADLRKQGFDVNSIKEPMFFFDGKQYVPLTKELFNSIQSGALRL